MILSVWTRYPPAVMWVLYAIIKYSIIGCVSVRIFTVAVDILWHSVPRIAEPADMEGPSNGQIGTGYDKDRTIGRARSSSMVQSILTRCLSCSFQSILSRDGQPTNRIYSIPVTVKNLYTVFADNCLSLPPGGIPIIRVCWFVGWFVTLVVISRKLKVRFSWNLAQIFSVCDKFNFR